MTFDKISSSISFLEWDDKFVQEKPYLLRMEVEDSEIPRTNIRLKAVEVSLRDLRPLISELSFQRDGIGVFEFEETMSYDDFHDPFKVQQIYLPNLARAVKDYLHAACVTIIPHPIDGALKAAPHETSSDSDVTTSLYKIRKRHPDFPISNGTRYDYEQPANVAHVDITTEELTATVSKLFDQFTDCGGSKVWHQWINVWKPLRGPLTDWPLALCKLEEDRFPVTHIAVDLVYPHILRETQLIKFDSQQTWFYLKEQSDSEHLLFLQSEVNGSKSRSGIAHAAFHNPDTCRGEAPRESIEVKLLITYTTT